MRRRRLPDAWTFGYLYRVTLCRALMQTSVCLMRQLPNGHPAEMPIARLEYKFDTPYRLYLGKDGKELVSTLGR